MVERIKFEETKKKIENHFKKLYSNEEIVSIKAIRFSPGNFLVKSYKKLTWWDKFKGLLKKQETLPVLMERIIYFVEDKYYYRVWVSYIRNGEYIKIGKQ